MRVAVDFSGLKKIKWSEYAVRFVFGGTITAVTGVLAALYGPKFGGLFLTFPAIFPASATLVEKHGSENDARPPGGCAGRAGRRDGEHRSDWIRNCGVEIGANLERRAYSTSAVWLAIWLLIWHLRRHRLFFRPKSC